MKKGTWYLKSDKDTYTDSSVYYDFNATLRAEEMDDRGMKGYVEEKIPEATRNGLTPEQWIENQIKKNEVKVDNDTKNYLMGVSDKKITDMKQEEIDKLTNALNAIIPQNESTGKDVYKRQVLIWCRVCIHAMTSTRTIQSTTVLRGSSTGVRRTRS